MSGEMRNDVGLYAEAMHTIMFDLGIKIYYILIVYHV